MSSNQFKVGDRVVFKPNWEELRKIYGCTESVIKRQMGKGEMVVDNVYDNWVEVEPDIGYRFRYEMLQLAREVNEV